MSFEVSIIPMSEHHVNDVLEIDHLTNPSPTPGSLFIKEITNPAHIMLVATGSSKVLGFCSAQIVSDELHIHSIAVSPEYRRNSIATKILNELINKSKFHNIKSATLEVRESNEVAIGLYEKFGFVVEGERPNYYSNNNETALLMWNRNLKEMS
ncbi:MAG: ribosomal protein S18-alanine N-acetyltransferase [Acidimicrobiia bacterium]